MDKHTELANQLLLMQKRVSSVLEITVPLIEHTTSFWYKRLHENPNCGYTFRDSLERDKMVSLLEVGDVCQYCTSPKIRSTCFRVSNVRSTIYGQITPLSEKLHRLSKEPSNATLEQEVAYHVYLLHLGLDDIMHELITIKDTQTRNALEPLVEECVQLCTTYALTTYKGEALEKDVKDTVLVFDTTVMLENGYNFNGLVGECTLTEFESYAELLKDMTYRYRGYWVVHTTRARSSYFAMKGVYPLNAVRVPTKPELDMAYVLKQDGMSTKEAVEISMSI